MKRIAIVGAGDFGKRVLQYILLQNKYVPVGFFDDYYSEQRFQDLPLLGCISDVEVSYRESKFDYLFIAVGYNHLQFKNELLHRSEAIPFGTIIHPSSIIEEGVLIESGVLICANTCIGINSRIGKGVIMHVSSFVPHDNTIGKCTYISPGVNIGGNTKIGDNCFIGIGATISDGLSICDGTIVGAASFVLTSIVEPGTYVGSPLRKIQKDD